MGTIITFAAGIILGAIAIAAIFNHFNKERLRLVESDLHNAQAENKKLVQDLSNQKISTAQKEEQLNALRGQFQNERQSFETLRQTTQAQFADLANKILEEKSEKFNKTNEESINVLLSPLKENIENFRKQVSETYDKTSRQNSQLEERIRNLTEQTNKISDEANNLTKALKGNSKTQGDWGEMILERVLEASGLTKGREYDMQVNVKDQEGHNLRPDALVYLPEDRTIIIDSKVSLTAYDRYFTADNKAEQETALKAHLDSVRSHINELADKRYDTLVKKSPDFTMMFIPVEPAYLLALQQDPGIWEFAYKKQVLLISPTNLIACLRMVESLWRQEAIAQNAKDIAEMGAKLYDKIINVFESMEDIGKNLEKVNSSYETAVKRIKDGRGSLLSQSQKFIDLGIKSNKSLPKSFET